MLCCYKIIILKFRFTIITSMIFDASFSTTDELPQAIEVCKIANKNGLDGVWINNLMTGGFDPFTLAAICFLNSKKMSLGIPVISPYIIRLENIVRAASTLAELSTNKFFLGLGVGGLNDLAYSNITPINPISTLRETIHTLKTVFSNYKNSKLYSSQHIHPKYNTSVEVPIYLGVRGVKMLDLAGTDADGIILSGSKTYIKNAVKLVKRRIKESNQPNRQFSFIAWIPTIIDPDNNSLKKAKSVISTIITDTPKSAINISDIDPDIEKKIKTTYREGGTEKASELVDEEMLNDFTITGDLKSVIDEYYALEKIGITRSILGPAPITIWRKKLSKFVRRWGLQE